MKKLMHFIPVILLTMLLTSCQSTKQYAPCPRFPELENYVKNNDGTVTVPEEYIVELAEFKIRYDVFVEVYYGQ